MPIDPLLIDPLPIDPLLPELVRRLPAGGTLLLQAPPGAGKTTRAPLALLRALALRVLVLLDAFTCKTGRYATTRPSPYNCLPVKLIVYG